MKRPVFVVGCPRSGTTLLYSMLLAAGGFAVYRKETHFYEVVPRFGDLTAPDAKRKFRALFLQGYLGKVPGTNVEPFVSAALNRCGQAIDFLPALMEGLAEAQQADRWIEATPTHALYIDRIKSAVPDALFVHVIRDGRDCALSQDKQGWIATLPWDRRRSVGVAALYWEWLVRTCRSMGRTCANDYFEVRFEDLVGDPRGSLARIAAFLDHKLDYDRIARTPVHALHNPNTSFREAKAQGIFKPVDRWKDASFADAVRFCELLVGPCLEELGYSRAYPHATATERMRALLTRRVYLPHFATKHWLKTRTPAGRFMIDLRVWARQPRQNERPFIPQPGPDTTTGRFVPGADTAGQTGARC